MQEKQCKDCKQHFSIEDFPIKAKRKNKKDIEITYREPRCGGCNYSYRKKWESTKTKKKRDSGYSRKYHKDYNYKKVTDNPDYNRLAWIKSKYGVSKEEYYQMREDCNNLCSICKEQEPTCVDHCHATNIVRGLLCNDCNILLGRAKDNTNILKEAIKYLQNE